MTVPAHGSRHIYNGATKTPLAPVRAGVSKRRRVGWLHCSVDEFLRLLAMHEAGEINLLEMDDGTADEDDADPVEPDEPIAQPRSHVGGGMTFGRVLFVLQQASKPLSAQQISSMSGTNIETVRDHLTSNDAFTLVGRNGCNGLWMLKSKVK